MGAFLVSYLKKEKTSVKEKRGFFWFMTHDLELSVSSSVFILNVVLRL